MINLTIVILLDWKMWYNTHRRLNNNICITERKLQNKVMNSISNKTKIPEPRQDFCYHTHTRRCAHAEDVEDEKYIE